VLAIGAPLRPIGASLRMIGTSLRAIGAALLAATAIAACGGASAKPVPVTPPALPPGHTMESIFEDEQQVKANPAQTLDLLRQLGVDRVRLWFDWQAIAPDPASRARPQGFDAANPAAYAQAVWAPYDAVVRAAAARGMGLDALLSGPAPQWATAPGQPPSGPPGIWKPSASEYGQFVRAVATRYSGSYTPPGESTPLPRIDFWSSWNEPNHGTELAPQTIDQSSIEVSPRVFRALLDAEWSALHATGHGHDTLLIGELAPTGATYPPNKFPGTFAQMVPLRFVRALYCVDSSYQPLQGPAAIARGCPPDAAGARAFPQQNPALFQASGFSVHPYSQGLPPDAPTPSEPDYADLADLTNLENALDAIQRAYGSTKQFPLWSTEFGYQTTPPDPEPGTVSLATAAYYLNWAEYISWRNPRIRSYDQYLLIDGPQGLFATGLELPNGTPKPSFFAYRMPIYLPVTAGASGQPLEVWGCARPAPSAQQQTGHAQQVQIQFSRDSQGSFATVQTVKVTDPHGYFDVRQAFTSSGEVRLAWSYPSGQTIYSRTVAITIS
jgi:hypothetical protein